MSKWITTTGYVRVDQEQDVFTAAQQRILTLYEKERRIVVAFSGGKDSTCCLMMTLEIARRLNKLPLDVVMVDEEVIDPDTIAYVSEVASWPDVRFHWLCLPMRHTLSSQLRSHWYTWDPDERAKWAREKPPQGISDVCLSRKDLSYGDLINAYFVQKHDCKDYITIAGIRTGESYNRLRAIMMGGTYVVRRFGTTLYTKPIYDWREKDVWKAIIENNWPHSAFYDKMWRVGVSRRDQRVAPWGNVAQRRNIQYYPRFYPDFWERAVRRLPELRPTARYGNTSLYRTQQDSRPHGLTWQEYTYRLLQDLIPDDRAYWVKEIKKKMRNWKRVSSIPFPDESFTIDGSKYTSSWKKLAYIIGKNDRSGKERSSRDRM